MHRGDEEPPLSTGEIGEIEDEDDEEVKSETNTAGDVHGEVSKQQEGGNDEEDTYSWIDVRKRAVHC